ncbi:TetR/AcrR family transcriptional regulator [Jeotgalicoccus sp. WY2]|uniref:TetR/AcrR family transcriptional regulator n=1 Tax=Jeotgalicoccus sp. WY2 TaxID=2708346 RepID=UPI001BD628A7|nr:TetR/AcrR family transcriptional regulator [Jeotgalicoccus sp. WY2]
MRKQDLYLDSRIVRTRKSLKNSLLILIMEKNFKDITVTDIVKSSNITRGSFYNHYTNKNELLESLFSDVLENLIYAYRKPFLDNRPFVLSKLPSSEVILFNNVYKHSNFYSIILNSDVSAEFKEKIYISFKKINEKELRVENDKIESDLIASYISYAIVGLVSQWVMDGYQQSPEFMNSQLIELMRISPNKTFHTRVPNYKY